MGGRGKLDRFADNRLSPYVVDIKDEGASGHFGTWKNSFFSFPQDLTLEFGCGRGEYTVALASKFPQRNFLGIDLKGDRIWVGAQMVEKQQLKNAGFIRCPITRIPLLVGPKEVNEIWLTFPDPRPKDREEKHRLTNVYFMNMYRSLLAEGGWFRFKTDNTPLFDYTLGVLESFPVKNLETTYDLYHSPLLDEHHGIQTKYERIWTAKGETIKYLKFQFT